MERNRILKTRCSKCNINYIKIVHKKGKNPIYNFICEECEKEIKKYLKEKKLKIY